MKKIEKLIIKGGGVGTPIRHSRVGTKFRLKMTLLNFCVKLTEKGCFRTKKNKNYLRILHIQINIDSKFQLQETIWIFGTNFKKKNTSGQKHKKTNIRLRLFGPNFQKR